MVDIYSIQQMFPWLFICYQAFKSKTRLNSIDIDSLEIYTVKNNSDCDVVMSGRRTVWSNVQTF